MQHVFRRFCQNSEGSTAIVFSLCLISVALAVGASIDFSRWQNAKTSAQAVTDAAALAAVSYADADETAMTAAAKKYLSANISTLNLQIDGSPTYTYDKSTFTFTVELKGRVSTSLMTLAGISEVEVNSRSVAVRPEVPPVEMALALDTTGSMAGTKIAALKTAATKMVTSVLKNKKAKVGIVPFSNYVNIGVSRRNEPFFDVPADYTNKVDSCTTSYPDKKGCYFKKVTKTCTGNNDGKSYTYDCSSNTEYCDDWGTGVKTCKKVDANYKFYGCVGSREENARAKIDDASKKYPGFLNVGCGPEIQDLTSNLNAAKAKINALSASGETYMPGGLTWGWNMLTASEPLTSAESATELAKNGGRKVLVLMTDGATTLVPTHSAKATHSAPASSTYKKIDYANTLSADLCSNIKKDGIDIYTVQFDVEDPKLETLLTDCASGPTSSFKAKDADELVAAFDKIVADLAQIRITN